MSTRETQVTAPAGAIVGTSDGEVRTFHSIPYAHVPVPFDSPAPAPTGLLIDATAPDPSTNRLSITTPEGARRNDDLPVIVFIHGGRFEEGSHTDTFSNPEGFARAGFVHVRVGYRLKFPGMLPLSGDAPHEYRAVQDCATALSWIQRNIEPFGGDPTNVTIVGHSAGADIALWLARRDHYTGEFRRAVVASPVFPRRSFAARKWAARGALGTPLLRRELNALAARNPKRIARAYGRFRTQYATDIALGPFPLEAGALARVPLVVTSTRDEFIPMVRGLDRVGMGKPAATLMARHMGVAKGHTRAYLERAAAMDPHAAGGRLISDAMCRRWVDQIAEGAPGELWLAELLPTDTRPAYHSKELTPVFSTGTRLNAWLTHFARTGEAGWRPYAEDRTVMRVRLDGAGAEEVTDPLGYLRGVFAPVAHEH